MAFRWISTLFHVLQWNHIIYLQNSTLSPYCAVCFYVATSIPPIWPCFHWKHVEKIGTPSKSGSNTIIFAMFLGMKCTIIIVSPVLKPTPITNIESGITSYVTKGPPERLLELLLQMCLQPTWIKNYIECMHDYVVANCIKTWPISIDSIECKI